MDVKLRACTPVRLALWASLYECWLVSGAKRSRATIELKVAARQSRGNDSITSANELNTCNTQVLYLALLVDALCVAQGNPSTKIAGDLAVADGNITISGY